MIRLAFAETQSPGIVRGFLFGCVANVGQRNDPAVLLPRQRLKLAWGAQHHFRNAAIVGAGMTLRVINRRARQELS